MAYTEFDSGNPVSSQTGNAAIASMQSDLLALWHDIVIGRAVGWSGPVAVGGTAEEPLYKVWSNGTLRLRGTFTYSSGYPTAVTWEYSANSGSTPNSTGTWDTKASETTTYDGSGNTTGGNNSSFSAWIYEWIGKFKALRTAYNATAAIVAALGTISTQAANAVAIAGGAIDATTIGATTPALGTFLSGRGKHTPVAFGGATTTLDLSTAESFSFTATSSGAATLDFSIFPASGILVTARIEIVNGGLRTWTYTNGKWGSATPPTLSSSGTDVIFMQSHDGGTTRFFSVLDTGFA